MTKMILVALAVLALMSACETMEGLGRDTQKLGSSLENAAQKNNKAKQNQNRSEDTYQSGNPYRNDSYPVQE